MKKRDIIPTLLDTASLGSAMGAIFSYIDWSNHGMYTIEYLIDFAPDNKIIPLYTAQHGAYIFTFLALGAKLAASYLRDRHIDQQLKELSEK